MIASLSWPRDALPHLDRAGRYPHDDRGFECAYLSATHALHLYAYAARMRLGADEVALQPGDATITPAGVESRYDLPRPGRHWCVHFLPAPARGDTLDLPLHLRLGAERPRVEGALRRLAELHGRRADAGGAVAEAGASAALLAILLDLAATAQGGMNAAARLRRGADPAAAAAARIAERLGDALVVPDLAAAVGVTQNYLARRFRARYGTTLHGYQLARRVEHAQLLLATTDLSVVRLAARLGFSDAQHFSKLFRRVAGTSPTAFRAGRPGR